MKKAKMTVNCLTENDLLGAAAKGDLETVYHCIWENVNVNCRSSLSGSTPLSLAAKYGHDRVVSVLLASHADPNLGDFYGVCPTHLASNYGHGKILSILLKHPKLDMSICRDNYGSFPLHFAAVSNQEQAVRSLIKAGSNPLLLNNAGFRASQVTLNDEIKNILVEEEERQLLIDKQIKANTIKTPTTKLTKKPRSSENVNASTAASQTSLRGSKDGITVKKSKLKDELGVKESMGSTIISNSKASSSSKTGSKSPQRAASPTKEIKVKTFNSSL